MKVADVLDFVGVPWVLEEGCGINEGRLAGGVKNEFEE